MKTLLNSLILACTLTLVTVSASLAKTNPDKRPASVATYKTGIYTSTAGKLHINLDKETTGAVDIKLKNINGKVLYTQHLTRKEKTARLSLDMDQLPDGAYQLEISNGVDTTTQTVTLGSQQPSTPNRLVVLN
ncbi:T9SS type A sorting domain-containing protein [Spirosoma sp. RP8]|uniref:T9SS type A sorting domain-containing protein n=1 Tax=Spirosoma liriopis TaxID=2937440 RepID=A0ABT0HUH8_9BACT|nr:T9SS type A sorting domain-containing protein [Spirosoma liriopis]MCK8495873.1 T9SS type A sorting domain-containing protein [Spirosoma liriopis]